MANDYCSLLNVQFLSHHIIGLLRGMRIVLSANFFFVKIIASFLLGAFAVLRKATVGSVMSVPLSVCPHVTTRLPQDGFREFLYLKIFRKSVKKFKCH